MLGSPASRLERHHRDRGSVAAGYQTIVPFSPDGASVRPTLGLSASSSLPPDHLAGKGVNEAADRTNPDEGADRRLVLAQPGQDSGEDFQRHVSITEAGADG